MKAVRWWLVFLFYVAADLSSPLMVTPLEAFDGEAEESIHVAGHRRVTRLAVARRAPTTSNARAALARSRPSRAPRTVLTRLGSFRKAPAPVPESASAPEDH